MDYTKTICGIVIIFSEIDSALNSAFIYVWNILIWLGNKKLLIIKVEFWEIL